MLLGYIDESGINYRKNGLIFQDGPYAIWTSLLVSELKYFHAERLFCKVAAKHLGVKNWKLTELHAVDIWNRKKKFSSITKDQARDYFEEFFQLLTKLGLNVVAGFQQKNIRRRSAHAKHEELDFAAYVLLTLLEHKLASLDETAVLIADLADRRSSKRVQELLYERTSWRQSPEAKKPRSYKSKFYFENQSCFLLDQIHYTESHDSFFIQLVDHVSYVLKRVFDYSYLKQFHKEIRTNPGDVPLSRDSFQFFSRNLTIGHFDKKVKDVLILFPQDLIRDTKNDEYLWSTAIGSLSEFK